MNNNLFLKPLLLLVGLLTTYGLMARRVKSRFYFYLGLFLCLAVVGYTYSLVLQTEDGLVYEPASVDLAIKYRLGAPTPSPKITIIDIDERSLAELAPLYGRWPWPREVMAEVLVTLQDFGAEAIALNIMYSDPDLGNPDSDALFDALACELYSTAFPMTRLAAENDDLSEIALSMLPSVWPGPQAEDQTIAMLIPAFPCTHDKLATNNLLVDGDGVVRRSSFYQQESGYMLPTLPGYIASLSGIAEESGFDESRPDNQGFLINWRNRSDGYNRVSFSDVYRTLVLGEESGLDDFDPTGKILVIGASAPGISVLKGTSLGPLTDDNEIIATAIDDLITGTALKPIDPWLNALLSCLFIFAMTFFFSRGLSEGVADGLFVVLEAATIVITILSVSYSSTILDLSATAIAGAVLFAVVKIHRFAEASARQGLGVFRSTPDASCKSVFVVAGGEEHREALGLLEQRFGYKNVFEVAQLLDSSNMLADLLGSSSYMFVFSDEPQWREFLTQAEGDNVKLSVIGSVDNYSSFDTPEENWQATKLDLAKLCLDDYAANFKTSR